MVREAVKFQFSDDFKIAFKRLLKKYRTLKQDLLKVMDEIQESPSEVGVPLFATVRKMRMAISAKGRGKSGGARLILSLYQQEGIVFFLFIYDKNEMENVSDEFIKEILKDMEDAENKEKIPPLHSLFRFHREELHSLLHTHFRCISHHVQGFGENCETCFRARLSNLLSDEKASVAPLLYSYG